ncbi:MAG: FtsX-like permease family protein [Culturomica sp.]|jgi:putative ABC transport system permease protein|nr:FtsX-like permease family protein [Culturomica sp.]
MWLTNLKAFRKFLANNKFFSFVIIFGFAISLMFVFLLSIYVKQELSVDGFHKNKDRIYLGVATNDKGEKMAHLSNPVGDYIKNLVPEVESYCRFWSMTSNLYTQTGGEKISTSVMLADPSFFTMFSFNLEEGDPEKVFEARNSAVVTRSLARKFFGDENPIGKNIYYNDTIYYMVTGIMDKMPENTQFPQVEMIANYSMLNTLWNTDVLSMWGNSSFPIYFMEKEGTSIQSKTDIIVEKFKTDYWFFEIKFATGFEFEPLTKVYFGDIKGFSAIKHNSKSLIITYIAITILILIVAILNYINLSVAQTGKRGKEAAIKKLVGCNKKQLLLQFISESVMMTFIALIVGVFFAFFAEPFFNDALNTKLDLAANMLDPVYLSSLILGILVIGIVVGIVPALNVSRFKPIEVIKGEYEKQVKTRSSKALISFQFVVAFILLSCSIFILKQYRFMKTYDLGFKSDNILVIDNGIESQRMPALKSVLSDIPGVENISFSRSSPATGSSNNQSFKHNGEPVSVQIYDADTNFISVFGIELTPTTYKGKDRVYLNRKAFAILQPDSGSLRVDLHDGKTEYLGGITNDFNIYSLHKDVVPVLIRLHDDDSEISYWHVNVKIADNADLFATADEVKRVYSDFIGGEPFNSQFADDSLQGRYEREVKTLKILTAFTILTFVILFMGIFAMSLFFVQQRQKEIAIRKVNGATEREIILMLNESFLKWIAVAFVISIPVVLYVMQKWLESFAYKTTLSWWVFLLTGAVVLLLSFVSVTAQTWKAAVANPVNSLKK